MMALKREKERKREREGEIKIKSNKMNEQNIFQLKVKKKTTEKWERNAREIENYVTWNLKPEMLNSLGMRLRVAIDGNICASWRANKLIRHPNHWRDCGGRRKEDRREREKSVK